MADRVTISILLPTISRPSLARTLRSLKMQNWQPGDEVLLIGDGKQPIAAELWRQFCLQGRYIEIPGPSKDWGHTPRNKVIPMARGTHIMAIDDDDEMVFGSIEYVRRELIEKPDVPHIFRMGDPRVGTVWKKEQISEGNVGTPMLVHPNSPGRIGTYASRYGGDCDFIRETCGHYPEGPVWQSLVICNIRPNAR